MPRASKRSETSGFPTTLWDLVATIRSKPRRPKKPPAVRTKAPMADHKPKPGISAQVQPKARASNAPSEGSMQAKYAAVTKAMLQEYGIRVRKWRSSMSGVAWEVTYRDGTVSRLIEAPKPTGPMSAAVFLHEIGHHAIGFKAFTPRCLEEYKAWEWSLNAMETHGLNVTDRVRIRMRESLEYALAKAKRRGLKQVPPELAAYFRESEAFSKLADPRVRAHLGLDTLPSTRASMRSA